MGRPPLSRTSTRNFSLGRISSAILSTGSWRGQGALETVLALDGGHPHFVEDGSPVLDGDQGPALDGFGQIDDGLLADLVAGFVGGEAERRRPSPSFLAGPAGPARPVDVDELARGGGA